MKKLFLIIAIALINQSLAAQEEGVTGKLFYTEAGGPGAILSANFDSRFKSNERLGFGYRVGVGFGVGPVRHRWTDNQHNYIYAEDLTQTYYSVPVGLNYVFGRPDSEKTFEVGAGVTFLTHYVSLYCRGERKPGHLIGFITFMYRMIPIDGGFSFRVGLTPILGTGGDLRSSAAIGFGYKF